MATKAKSSHVLVKFSDSWADEFDIHGFKVMKRGIFNRWLKTLEKRRFPTDEIGFGTNEAIEYDSLEDYKARLKIIDIDETQAKIIRKLFGSDYGTFLDPTAGDDDDEEEENESI